MNTIIDEPTTLDQEMAKLSEYVPLAQVADELPRRRRGRKTSVATLYRWTSVGCRGQLLQSIQIGATRCTTRAWLAEFFGALTAARSGQAPSPSQQPATSFAAPTSPAVRSAAQRTRDHERADRELSKLGF